MNELFYTIALISGILELAAFLILAAITWKAEKPGDLLLSGALALLALKALVLVDLPIILGGWPQ